MPNKFPFTEAKVKALPLPERGTRTIYYDSETRGLAVRVLSTGAKTFYVQKTIRGKPERITLGRASELSIKKARQLAAEIHLQVNAGINPNELKRAVSLELTLNDFFKVYLENHIKSHNKRPDETEAEYKRYIEKPLGKSRLSEITKASVAGLHAKTGKTIGNRTANKVHSQVRAIYNRAIEWGYFTRENPANGVKRFKEEKRERFLSAEELKRFSVALAVEANPLMRDFFLTLLFTGARSGEVRAMKWDDLELDSGVWRLDRNDTKGDQSRVVVLPIMVVEILRRREAEITLDSQFVFASHGRSGYLQEPKKAWARIMEAAKINNFRIHDLRHTWASWMVAQGVSLPVVQRALGHKSITSTAIYANTNLELIQKETAKTALVLSKIFNAKPGNTD